ncbi:hypothetical protein [Rheinheimera baltica]|uniref:hypothetical protein n=1 Tax=Rheinheimera baltica TaxID=67576 RepID=UPI0003FAF572|nr:hypothetical protein [Rheinheimera baltica]
MIVGAVFGAGADILYQMLVEGKSFGCVDFGEVALAAAMGAVGGGVVDKLGKLRKVTRGVPKPTVTDPKLNNLVKDLYKGAETKKPIGTGSTADAIRHEALTGNPVGGKFHTAKGEQYANALNKWLKKNPNASPSDRSAAQAILNDINNALGGGK